MLPYMFVNKQLPVISLDVFKSLALMIFMSHTWCIASSLQVTIILTIIVVQIVT